MRTTAQLGLSLLVAFATGCHTSDTILEKNFAKNEAHFEELRAMLISDPQVRIVRRKLVIGSDDVTLSSRPRDLKLVGLPRDRYAAYLRLFDLLDLQSGVLRSGQTIWLEAQAPSFFNGSISQGYIYSISEPDPLVPDLDSYVPAPTAESRRPRYLVFKRLKQNWYLFKNSE